MLLFLCLFGKLEIDCFLRENCGQLDFGLFTLCKQRISAKVQKWQNQLGSGLSQNDPAKNDRCASDADYLLQATDLCERFYKSRNGTDGSTSVKCVAQERWKFRILSFWKIGKSYA